MNVAGTNWEGKDSNGDGKTYLFREDGVLQYTSLTGTYDNGTWEQDRNAIYFETNGKYAEYHGTIVNGVMSGSASNVTGKRWTWSLEQLNLPIVDGEDDDDVVKVLPPRLWPPPFVSDLLWQPLFNSLDYIVDGRGLDLDPGIKRTVLAFQLMGLETNFSCEGHTDVGYPTPVIRFARVSPELRDGLGLRLQHIQKTWFDSFYADRYFDSDLSIGLKKFGQGGEISIRKMPMSSREREVYLSQPKSSDTESFPLISLTAREKFLKASRQEMSDFTNFVLDTMFKGKIPQVIQDLPQLTEQPLIWRGGFS